MPEINFPAGGNLMDPADPNSALKPAERYPDAPSFPGGKEPGRDTSLDDKPPHQTNNEPPPNIHIPKGE